MRIIYVLTSLGVGGAERQVLALATRMTARSHAVAILVLRPELDEECPTSVEVVHLNMRRNPLSVLVGLWRARRFVCEFGPDLVHSHSFHANFIARILKVLVPSPVFVCTIHNVYEGGWARMWAYRLSDGLCSRTTAVSSTAAERFVRLKAVPQRKCMVLTNGIDTKEFAPDERRRIARRSAMGVASEFVWMSVGRVVPAKDFPNLLAAFRCVAFARPEARLWIAGEATGQERSRLEHDLREANVGPAENVRWLGLRRDLAALLDAADGFVLASAWEGMPLVIGEEMAMEKAIVATDVGGVSELLGTAGDLVSPRDAERLGAAMLATMDRPLEDRQRQGKAARARVAELFNMDARADAWEALYRAFC